MFSRSCGSSSFLKNTPLAELAEEDVRSKVTGGRILVRIDLAEEEIADFTAPPPLHLVVPRLAYLHTVAQEAQEHFEAWGGKQPRFGRREYIWFDHKTVALNCQLPVGVLCDVMFGKNVPRPLELTIHFNYCPIHMPCIRGHLISADLTTVFENSFRESVCLAHKSSKPFAQLEEKLRLKMAASIAKGGVDSEYLAVQKTLLCKNLKEVESLAVRIHLRLRDCPASDKMFLDVLQKTAPVFQEDGQPTTVLHHLYGLLPTLAKKAGYFPTLTCKEGKDRLADGVELLSHGVEIPLQTPLYSLALHASYLDQFVHLVLRVPASLSFTAK